MTVRRAQGDGTVYFDAKRNRWIGAVNVAGKRRKVTAASKSTARKRLNELLAAKTTGTPLGNRSVTVGSLVDKFLERELPNRRLTAGSVVNYKWAAGVIKDEIGTMRTFNLTIDDVEAMLDRLAGREQPLYRESLTRVRGVLSQVLDFGVKRKQVRDNVARGATLPPDALRSEQRRALTADQANTLLSTLRQERNGAMFALSLRLGLRPSESAGLYWEDLDGGGITINRSRKLVNHGGRVEIVPEVKTRRSRRTIALPHDMLEWLGAHRREQLAERLAAGGNWIDERIMFASPTGNVLFPSNTGKYLRQLCVKSGVPTVSPNELRHTCASLLSHEMGVPNEELADLLGHTTTRMVEMRYRHSVRPSVDVAARADWTKRVVGT